MRELDRVIYSERVTRDSENAVTEAAPDLCTDRQHPLGDGQFPVIPPNVH
jgi:hypothetical protein